MSGEIEYLSFNHNIRSPYFTTVCLKYLRRQKNAEVRVNILTHNDYSHDINIFLIKSPGWLALWLASRLLIIPRYRAGHEARYQRRYGASGREYLARISPLAHAVRRNLTASAPQNRCTCGDDDEVIHS